MIQRKQSLFLLGSAIFTALMFVFPISSASLELLGDQRTFNYDITSEIGMMAVAGLSIGVSLITIFVFNNRPLQSKLSWGVAILGVVQYGLIWYFGTNISQGMPDSIKTNFGLGIIMPGLSIALAYLAASAINKDEDLVKSADRFR